MAELLRKIIDTYNYLFYDLCDDRTRYFFPYPVIVYALMPFYVYFSVSLGPRLMKNVKPFKLKTPIFYFNISQIILNSYIIYEGIWSWLHEYSWTCQPVDMSTNPATMRMIHAFWWYTVVKLMDLMDTVFFVLRKKDRQISFLHVFHHTGMVLASYFGVKYYPNGHATLVGLINCFVHVVMYTYYLISGLGPEYQKYLWWKRYLTTLQMVQFTIIFLHNLSAIISDCGFPRWISLILCIQSLQFLYMFGNFYYVNYIKNAEKEDKTSDVRTNSGKTE